MKNKYIKPEIKVQTIEMEQGICAGSTNYENAMFRRGYCKECGFRKREVCSSRCSYCNHSLEYN